MTLDPVKSNAPTVSGGHFRRPAILSDAGTQLEAWFEQMDSERKVLLAIIQRLLRNLELEAFLAEVIALLEQRLELRQVVIGLSASSDSTALFPSSPAWIDRPWLQADGASSSPALVHGSHEMVERLSVPIQLDGRWIGQVSCRIDLADSGWQLSGIESFLTLVAGLLACGVAKAIPPSFGGQSIRSSEPGQTLQDKTCAMERAMIAQTLKQTRGNMAAAARCLGITPRMIRYKVRKLKIDWRQLITD